MTNNKQGDGGVFDGLMKEIRREIAVNDANEIPVVTFVLVACVSTICQAHTNDLRFLIFSIYSDINKIINIVFTDFNELRRPFNVQEIEYTKRYLNVGHL